MNRSERPVAERPSFNGRFARAAVRVGRKAGGGHEGALDAAEIHPERGRSVRVERPLDADADQRREARSAGESERGRRCAPALFAGSPAAGPPDRVVVHTSAMERSLGGGRPVTTAEPVDGPRGATPASGAVPGTLPPRRPSHRRTAATALVAETVDPNTAGGTSDRDAADG